MNQEQKKCKRGGCGKKYTDQENIQNSCNFHTGKPLFHDTKKGWTCCNQIVYDWDEFQKIIPCAQGMHSDIDPNQQLTGQDQFYKSSTVGNAQKALDKEEQKVVIKKISDFNKQDDKQQQQQAQLQIRTDEKKKIITQNGNYKCTNKGCQKEFSEKDNTDEACKYHKGEPIFHDLKKFWSCCNNVSYDWDEFMKIPTCTVGKHTPKYE